MKNSSKETSSGSLDKEKERNQIPRRQACAQNFFFFFKCCQMGITGVTDGYVLLKSQEYL